jgi:hypothetical protein
VEAVVEAPVEAVAVVAVAVAVAVAVVVVVPAQLFQQQSGKKVRR